MRPAARAPGLPRSTIWAFLIYRLTGKTQGCGCFMAQFGPRRSKLPLPSRTQSVPDLDDQLLDSKLVPPNRTRRRPAVDREGARPDPRAVRVLASGLAGAHVR